jgi:hypothetical protein
MSLSGPNSISFLVTNAGTESQHVYAYTSAEAAQADFIQQDGAGGPCYLYLEAIPTKELKPTKVGGTYVDAFGVTRIFTSGVNGGEID